MTPEAPDLRLTGPKVVTDYAYSEASAINDLLTTTAGAETKATWAPPYCPLRLTTFNDSHSSLELADTAAATFSLFVYSSKSQITNSSLFSKVLTPTPRPTVLETSVLTASTWLTSML